MVRRLLKTLAGLGIAAALFLALVISPFSVESTTYKCDGRFYSAETGSVTGKVFVKIERHLPWLFWADDYGRTYFESMPNNPIHSFVVKFYRLVAASEHALKIMDFDESQKGVFSTLSGRLSLETYAGRFEGECSRITV